MKKPFKRQYVNFKAWAEAYNIYCKSCRLGAKFWGYVYKSMSGAYLVIISSNLTREMQQLIFCHEVNHIIRDMPNKSYYIGLGRQYDCMERKADKRAKKLVKKMKTNFF